jgi:hypothetical protein
LPSALQHAFFHILAGLEFFEPSRVDINMARAARTSAAAERKYPLNAVLRGRFHQRNPDRGIYLAPETVRLNERNARHESNVYPLEE